MSHCMGMPYPRFLTIGTMSLVWIFFERWTNETPLAILPQIFKLDSVMITKKEIVNSVVFYECFNEKGMAFKSVKTLQNIWNERQKCKVGEKTEKKSPEKKKL